MTEVDHASERRGALLRRLPRSKPPGISRLERARFAPFHFKTVAHFRRTTSTRGVSIPSEAYAGGPGDPGSKIQDRQDGFRSHVLGNVVPEVQ